MIAPNRTNIVDADVLYAAKMTKPTSARDGVAGILFAKFLKNAAILSIASLIGLGAFAYPSNVSAGQFSMDLGTNPNWVSGATTQTFVLQDQFGFALTVTGTVTQAGGTAVSGFPLNEVGFFGTATSLGLIWDSNSGSSGVGEATNTATLSFFNGGTPFAVNSVSYIISDVDSVDNDAGTDRCDFITATGNAGNPTIALVNAASAATSVRIGPSTGSGSTGTLAANQAQCIYNVGAATSPNSAGDDNGSVRVTWPSGTSVATVAYDESIENVRNNTNLNAAARGVGIWASSVIAVDSMISLAKAANRTHYVAAGETINYTYTLTNNGPLPINTGQNIQINDDQIGIINCPDVTTPIPTGGTHICTANYTTTAADASSANVVNIATAGVGTGTQSFATRLQSNSPSVTVLRETPAITLVKSAGSPSTAAGASPTLTDGGDTIAYSYTVNNTGNVTINNVSITDIGPTFNGNAGTGTLTTFSPVTASIAAGASQIFTATYTLSQTDVDNSAGITNGVDNSANANGISTGGLAIGSNNSNALTTIGGGPAITVTKLADQTSNIAAGTTVTYTYRVVNTGNQTIQNITLTDIHNGSGTAPSPSGETLASDNGPAGDSTDSIINNGVWDSLAPTDEIEFTGIYVVTQQDIETLQ